VIQFPRPHASRVDPLFIVMPAYNAAETIEPTFDRIPAGVRERIARYVVVNDGSKDATASALHRLQQGLPNLVVLDHAANRGYGAAEKTLLRYARDNGAGGTILLHADGQYPPERLADLVAPIERNEAEMVQGSRMLGGGALGGGMPLYKFVANKALTRVQNWAFGMGLAEYHSGYLAYSKRVLTEIPFDLLSDSFDIDIEMMIAAHILGMRIVEVAIPARYAGEVSHLQPIRYGLDVLAIVARYRSGHYHRMLGRSRDGTGQS